MRLAGKVAIVTGASSGIGQAVALRFAREGARVMLTDLDGPRLQVTQGLVRGAGGGASACMTGDISTPGVADAIATAAVEEFGAIDILLNSAAVTAFGTVEDAAADASDLDRMLSINVRGAWLLARAVIPHMRAAGGGSIVQLASITGIVGAPGMAAYSTSKGAIITLTRTLALELAEHQIRVNCICPASIDTPMLQASFDRLEDPAAARARNVKRHPLGRFGTPEDVANLALFLASDESAFITGGTHVIDGGALLARRWAE
jgi:NAD(P)-dependent dehydrogenase (short-subunit alcohol dehydrogenase family)